MGNEFASLSEGRFVIREKDLEGKRTLERIRSGCKTADTKERPIMAAPS